MPEDAGAQLSTLFTHHLGERLHVTTFARPSKYVANLALSVQRSGGVLNVLGARDDVAPVPDEFKIDDSFRRGIDFKFAYGGNDGKQKELGYRRILFKRLLFLWRLAQQLPPRDLLMYVDGDDVLFQRPLDDAVTAWRELVQGAPNGEEPVIFMGYPSCAGRFNEDHAKVVYPIPGSKKGLLGAAACARWRAKQPRGTLPFLDSGGYMGRASMIRLVLEDALEFARLGLDYICMSTLTVSGIRLGPSKLRVDSEAKLFYSARPFGNDKWANWTPEVTRPFCEPSYFDEAGRPAAFSPTGEVPAVLHFVGPSKWYWLNPCMEAFRERRRLELSGMGSGFGLSVVAAAGDSKGAEAAAGAAAAAASGALAGGFADGSAHYCIFNFGGQCDPCDESRPDCACTLCQSTEGVFMYYDVDRASLIHAPFSALLG